MSFFTIKAIEQPIHYSPLGTLWELWLWKQATP
jgi:hypothetical protein